MAVYFKNDVVRFDPTKGRKQKERGSVTFTRDVKRACAVLQGFSIGYTDGDHHIKHLEVDVDRKEIVGPTVNFNVDFLLRDSSGNMDDRYNGWVQVMVIAELYN